MVTLVDIILCVLILLLAFFGVPQVFKFTVTAAVAFVLVVLWVITEGVKLITGSCSSKNKEQKDTPPPYSL
jgi:purine-cytosine permease-like protein